MLILMCDGASKGNPGKASIGVVAWKREPGTASARRWRPTHKISKDIGEGTNNDAEWMAVLEGLRYARSINNTDEVYIYTDSMLVVCQAKGQWKIRQDNMRDYNAEYHKLRQGMKVEITWLPRQLTYLADRET